MESNTPSIIHDHDIIKTTARSNHQYRITMPETVPVSFQEKIRQEILHGLEIVDRANRLSREVWRWMVVRPRYSHCWILSREPNGATRHRFMLETYGDRIVMMTVTTLIIPNRTIPLLAVTFLEKKNPPLPLLVRAPVKRCWIFYSQVWTIKRVKQEITSFR